MPSESELLFRSEQSTHPTPASRSSDVYKLNSQMSDLLGRQNNPFNRRPSLLGTFGYVNRSLQRDVSGSLAGWTEVETVQHSFNEATIDCFQSHPRGTILGTRSEGLFPSRVRVVLLRKIPSLKPRREQG